jgi:hypothetical protein
MFEAAVIITLTFWALIIFIFAGVASGLIFIFFLLFVTLSGIAFALVQLGGLISGLPIFMYICALCVLAVIAMAASNPHQIKYYSYKLSMLINRRHFSRPEN